MKLHITHNLRTKTSTIESQNYVICHIVFTDACELTQANMENIVRRFKRELEDYLDKLPCPCAKSVRE